MHQIDEHICSFPAREKNYSRSDNHHKVYLSPELSIAKMHEMYLEVHEQSVFDEISEPVLTRITTYHLDVLDRILVQYVMNWK